MSTVLEYTFSLQDKVSAKLSKISGSSEKTARVFETLQQKTGTVSRTLNDTGRSMGALKEKIDLLQAERDWIPASNIEGIRAYNREIKKLNREVTQLENLNGGKFKQWGKEAFAAMPGADLVRNPLVAAGAAAGFSVKQAMNLDEGLAKVNITAQLDEKGLTGLKSKLGDLAETYKVDLAMTPVGVEKIISQVGDLDTSMQIFEASLKGSKAGFTDLDTVSGALAQSLSIIGKENTNAQEVLDTFFAAKRVGAGEFADFARYMPGLIAGASNMGVSFKETAGVFAYMTGKGQSAEKAAVLMENAFAALGKSDIRGKLSKAGVDVFDKTGKMRSMVDIFTDLQKVTGALNDEQKSAFLEKIGLVDKEAKGAFAIMSADLGKLRESMDAVNNSSGETDAAMKLSANAIQKSTEIWNTFKNVGTEIGGWLLPAVSVGLSGVGAVLSWVYTGVRGVTTGFAWWMEQLQEGNGLITVLTGALTGVATAFAVYLAWSNKGLVMDGAQAIVRGALAVKTGILTASQWMLNTALWGCPIVWIVAGMAAIGAGIVYLWKKFDWFRGGVYACWEALKGFGILMNDFIIGRIKGLISGLGSVASALLKLFQGDFAGAWEEAKKGASGLLGTDAGKKAVAGFKKIGEDAGKAYQKGVADFATDKEAKLNITPKVGMPDMPNIPTISGIEAANAPMQKTGPIAPGITQKVSTPELPATPGTTSNTDFDALMKKLGGDKTSGKKGAKTEKAFSLKEKTDNYQQTADYTSITRRLTPNIPVPSSVKVAAAAIPLMAVSPKAETARLPEPIRQEAQDNRQYAYDNRSDSQTVQFGDIVIHVASAKQEDIDLIAERLIATLTNRLNA